MNNCKGCIRRKTCQKAEYIENYKIRSDCGDFIHEDWYELLHDLSLEQIEELKKFADSLRTKHN